MQAPAFRGLFFGLEPPARHSRVSPLLRDVAIALALTNADEAVVRSSSRF
jgi:hypothetical protein